MARRPLAERVSTLMDRRRFLMTTGAAAMLPSLLSGERAAAATAAQTPATPANNRINLGVIGMGWQGPGNTKSFLALEDCQVVAACDINKKTLDAAVKMVNDSYGTEDCKGYHDYRELLARPDIDAVMIAVPDHWHGVLATAAAAAKKDIYGEKPLGHTIMEQQAIVRAVEANNVVWQMGSWQRSVPTFHKAAEIVRNGMIGTVTRVEVGLPGGNSNYDKAREEAAAALKAAGLPSLELEAIEPGSAAWKALETAPPAGLDYETWIGPSKMEPYIKARGDKNWRWNYNTGGGHLMDWIGHHCDIAHWGLNFDHTQPLEVEGEGELLPSDAVWNSSRKYRFELKYPGGVTMVIAGGYPDIKSGTKWIGSEGYVYVDRGKFETSRPEWNAGKYLPRELRKVKLYESANHWQNFLDCIRSRQTTVTPVQTGHNSALPGHLCDIAMKTKRKIHWDAKRETITGDPAAAQLMGRTLRGPWKLS